MQSSRVVMQHALSRPTCIARHNVSFHFQTLTGGARRHVNTQRRQDSVADKRQKMVFLGSGWATCNAIQNLGPAALRSYDIKVVSPKNYFVYTPMLPSVTVGTLEPRSIVEPVRTFIVDQLRKVPEASIEFTEAEATSIDIDKKTIKCVDASPITCSDTSPGYAASSVFSASDQSYEFEIDYDVLVLGVGATTNTFGTPGAMEHCLFLKSVSDALQIRSAVLDCFETASVAHAANEKSSDIDRMLSFVVVGAGPTGVEVAAELHDYFEDNVKKTYPHLKDHKIKVQIVEMGNKVLSTYDKAISEYTQKRFKRNDIEVLTEHQVKKVNECSIEVMDLNTKETKVLPFGVCVWASGVRPADISLKLAKSLGTRMLETDSCLRVRGAEGSIFALGDCAKLTVPSMKAAAKDLFEKADRNKDGELSREEFLPMMEEAAKTHPHMESYLGAVSQRTLSGLYSSIRGVDPAKKAGGITPEAFEAALIEIDKKIRLLPPTAQVAAQQGVYMGRLLSEVPYEQLVCPEGFEPAFHYDHQGSMAYVGSHRAVIDSPSLGVWKGLTTMFLWKGAYWSKSVSLRCKILMAFDWTKTALLGRDTARFETHRWQAKGA